MTTASPAGNALKGLLGDRFLCMVCQRYHAPDSRLITTCQRRFVLQEIHDRHQWWNPDTRHYYDRLRWYTAQRRLTEPKTKIINDLLTTIHRCGVHESFESATLAEIASPDGKALLAARHAQWKQTADTQIAQAVTNAHRLIERLETLLPLPYPADTPTGHFHNHPRRATPQWTPAPSSQAEIDRVAAVFSPPAKITRSGYRLILTGAIPDWLSNIVPYRRNSIDLELLGLDSTFWQNADLTHYRKRLTLRTHAFALTSPEPPKEPTEAPTAPPQEESMEAPITPPQPEELPQQSSEEPSKPVQLTLFPKDSGS